jgi:hypothetical protein
MKTSKIIFFSLLGIIATFIIAGAMDIRINGTKITSQWEKKTLHRKNLDSFKVLSINNARDITLIQNDSSFIEIDYLAYSPSKDTITAPIVNYAINKDTLKIADFRSPKGKRIWVNVKVNYTEQLNSIHLKNSSLTVEGLTSKKLSIVMDSSFVTANERSKESEIGVLNVFGKNKSDFQIRTGKFKIDSLNIVLRNSKAYLYSNENRLSCDISKKSNLRLTEQPLEIVMKKDTTSQFSVRETQTVYRR